MAEANGEPHYMTCQFCGFKIKRLYYKRGKRHWGTVTLRKHMHFAHGHARRRQYA